MADVWAAAESLGITDRAALASTAELVKHWESDSTRPPMLPCRTMSHGDDTKDSDAKVPPDLSREAVAARRQFRGSPYGLCRARLLRA